MLPLRSLLTSARGLVNLRIRAETTRALTQHRHRIEEERIASTSSSSEDSSSDSPLSRLLLGVAFASGVAAGTFALRRRSGEEGGRRGPGTLQAWKNGLLTVRAAEAFRGSGDSGSKSPRRLQFNFIADVVEEVAASLVYIEIKDLGVRDYFTGLPVTNSNGSGFVVKEDGLILTNAHVVINKPNASVQVRLQDGRTFTGVVEDVDVKSDLATVRIPCKGLPVMPLGESSSVRPGEFVIALGSPLSLSNTITTGVVSTASRARDELGLRDRDVPDYIQTDAAITFGNSGGPLVNLDGHAIGINSMKVTPGISFAIPIDYAKEFLAKSEEARKARGGARRTGRRYMGITMLTINPQIIEELRARLEMPAGVKAGIVIFRIVRESPADRAGLMPGDIVTHVNGSPIHGSTDVYKHLEGTRDLKMKVVRKDKYMEVTVKPESHS